MNQMQWYLAKSKPRKERLLVSNLTRWDVETFYPYIKQRDAGSGRLEPLFPSYVFCRMDPRVPEWQAIRWAPGLSYFLHVADELATVPDDVVEYLKDRTLRWNEGEMRKRFNPGDRIAIVSGPFAGLEAVFKDYVPSRDRCHVLLDAVQGVSSLEVPERDLDVVSRNWRGRFAEGMG